MAERFQLRTEFFNSLNRPEFGLPNATAGVAGAGTIATTQRANQQNTVRAAVAVLTGGVRVPTSMGAEVGFSN